MRIDTFALAAVAAGFLFAGPAAAAPLAGSELQARVAGAEFRGSARTTRGNEDAIWRFSPDGTVTAIGGYSRSNFGGGVRTETRDAGRWRIDANRLCIDWQASGNVCYTVDAGAGSWVVLRGGPALYEGSLSR
jgi:hypothetical protein